MIGKPVNDRITVKIDRLAEREIDGIIIPQDKGEHLQDAQWGECVAVADSVEGVKKGMKVLLPRMSGHDLHEDGVKYVITKFEDILAIEE